MTRTACIWIPQFELRARVCAEPSLRDRPLLIADAGAMRAVVLDASAEAQRQGVQRQMPMTAARALCPEAVIIPPDPAFVQALSQRILSQLYRFSPTVGRDGQEAFFLQLDGLERLHPDEHRLARALHQTIEAFELTAAVAIAGSPISAWIVARATRAETDETIAIVPAGQDRDHLARLPLDAIPMPEQIVRICRVLGLERVGELQELPSGALSRRFGQRGAELERRAHARCRDLFRIEIPETIEQSEIQLDQPTADLEPLLFLHKSVLDRLVKQVAARRRAIAALELTLVLGDSERSSVCRLFRPARPTLDRRVLIDLLSLWLQSGPVGEPVDCIVMRAPEVGIATARQLHLFDKQEDLAEDALARAISRLIAAYGPGAVVKPELADRYLPERRIVWKPFQAAEDPGRAGSRASGGDHPAAAATGPPPLYPPVLCLLDPPQLIELRGDRLRRADDRRWRRIVASSEWYPLEGEWWANGFARTYALLTTEDNERLWIYRDAEGHHLQAYLD